MQTGLWGMQVTHVNWVDTGEGKRCDVYEDSIQPILELMAHVNHDASLRTVGGRCSSMADLRNCLINSYMKPGSEGARIDVSTVVEDANSHRATAYSQRALAGLLAMQLIGAGYNIKSTSYFDHQNPQPLPLVGVPNGFQGYKLGGVLLHGIDTNPKKVQKVTDFMQTVRGLARGLLRQHETSQGSETRLGATDQLAQRARLVLLAAKPDRLQANPDLVKSFVNKLNHFESRGINRQYDEDDRNMSAAQLVPELQAAKRVLLR